MMLLQGISIVKYYMILAEIKDFNVLIRNESFFEQLVRSKEKACGKLIEMSRNNDYTTKTLLDYLYHQNYYKNIGTELSRQAMEIIAQKIDFVGKT